VTPGGLFGFTQFEFGFLLGPGDGRYLMRRDPNGDPTRVLVLSTLGAPERRRLRRGGSKAVDQADPTPVPTSRATLVHAEPFAGEEEAGSWLDEVRRDGDAQTESVAAALFDLNLVLRFHRAASGDPYAREVARHQALVLRLGYGSGEAVAYGRFGAAYEIPTAAARRGRREVLPPQERLAALVGAKEPLLACEELVLRARADRDAGRPRESALQARIALEAMLAEVPAAEGGEGLTDLGSSREAVGEAANAALRGDPPEELQTAVGHAIDQMEKVLRRRRAVR